MFGLMKRSPRGVYCGTCKSLGAIYGHKTRLLLNHDIAFLSEVLLELSGNCLSGPAYRSLNCLSLPRLQEIPVTLQYTAAASVALAHLRIADHRRDATGLRGKLAWATAERTLARSYRKAAADLRSWNFPLDQMLAALATQKGREANPRSLAHVAEPTMIATGLVFSHGVRLAVRPDRAADAMRLGRKFGELIYLLDAYDDRERDARTGAFNPFTTFREQYPGVPSIRKEILKIVSELEHEMTPEHAARLRVNIEERLGLRPRVIQTACRQTLRDRIRDAIAFARSLRNREAAGFFKGAVVMASVSIVAFVFPHHSRHTESWQECMGIPANLMALGSMFAATPPPPPPPPQQGPLPPGFHVARPDPPSMRSRGAGCWGSCKDGCAESCVEGILEGICGG